MLTKKRTPAIGRNILDLFWMVLNFIGPQFPCARMFENALDPI